MTGEVRGNFETDLLGWQRPSANIPALLVPGETLPGSPASYFFDNRGKSGELNASLIATAGKHVVKFGGGWLGRWIDGAITEPEGALTYRFANLTKFAADQPNLVRLTTTRVAAASNQYVEPQQDRNYRYDQLFLFLQDSVRVTSRLAGAPLGVRCDFFGSPTNTGPNKDWLIQLGQETVFRNASRQRPSHSRAHRMSRFTARTIPTGRRERDSHTTCRGMESWCFARATGYFTTGLSIICG